MKRKTDTYTKISSKLVNLRDIAGNAEEEEEEEEEEEANTGQRGITVLLHWSTENGQACVVYRNGTCVLLYSE